jgi:Flp pilus assembly protein TadD
MTALCCLLALPLAAAPSSRPGPAPAGLALEDAVRERGLDPELLIRPWEPGPNLRAWLSRQAVGWRPAERLRVAFDQLLAAGGVGLEYDRRVTGTADEVFASGRANCLGFALLFVGMARELGVEAGFFRIERGESYHRERDLIYVSEHITAGYEADGEVRMVEFTFDPEVDYRRAVAVSDLAAMALFYSNRGAEALRDDGPGEAVPWLEVAVRLDAAEPATWTNLGVARRRLGQLDAAEAIYRRAIEIDPDHLAAYLNLSALLQLRGESDAAHQIVRLLDRGGNRNPYAYLALGDASLEDERLEDARRYYRQAIRLGRGDAEPRAAMGLWALSNGDEGSARRWLRRARRIDQHETRTLRLEQTLNQHPQLPGTAAAAAGPVQSEREVES